MQEFHWHFLVETIGNQMNPHTAAGLQELSVWVQSENP